MNPPVLEKIVDLIVPLVNPDQIVLFGSYARGDYSEKSDIDLLVLKKGMDDEGEVIDNIYYSFLGQRLGIPVDILALDSDKYLELSDVIGCVYKQIKKDGKLVYEAL